MRKLAPILTGLLFAAAPAIPATAGATTTWKPGIQRERQQAVLTMPRAERVVIREILRVDQPRAAKITRCWWLQRTVVRCWVREIDVPGIHIESGGTPVLANELDWQWTVTLHRGHVSAQAF